MTTDLFLGGMTILTMAAIIIIAMTSTRRDHRSGSNEHFRTMASRGKGFHTVSSRTKDRGNKL